MEECRGGNRAGKGNQSFNSMFNFYIRGDERGKLDLFIDQKWLLIQSIAR